MPLRDHFRPPLFELRSWEGFHGGWPMEIVRSLSRVLPPQFIAEPHVHHGQSVEIDVATFDEIDRHGLSSSGNGGLSATATWAPPEPSISAETDLPDMDEYEVRVYDAGRPRRLVAAIELVSPSNKDRPEHRRGFVAKCCALLQKQASVTIIDLVTTREFNLYLDLLELLGQASPNELRSPPYAAACRYISKRDRWHLEAWERPLTVGQSLPTLPLWLAADLSVPLNLEESYEETCRVLRIN
jgi:hypothetical protein